MTRHVFIDGIKCFSPEKALTNVYFPKEGFTNYLLEETIFWFKIRSEIIKYILQKYVLAHSNNQFMEIGCGTGYVLKCLSKIKDIKLSGAEIHIQGLRHARERLPRIDFFQIDITSSFFFEKQYAIGAFDVLEHIEDDGVAIANIFKSLKPGGMFVLTVPQHQWLWSNSDDVAWHKRRYSRTDIIGKLKKEGFVITYCSSFVFSLFPVLIMSRLLNGKKRAHPSSTEFNLPSILNRVFYFVSKLDIFLIKLGLSLPFGGSLVLVAKRER